MRKKLWMTFLCCVFGVFLQAGVPENWCDDLEAAKVTAKKENKAIYVLFTGSDWCPYCIRLHDDVLKKREFREYAGKKLVLVYCDFPRANGPDAAQLARQRRWSAELKAGRGVPSAVILSPDGKVLGRISGYMPQKEYLEKLKEIVR